MKLSLCLIFTILLAVFAHAQVLETVYVRASSFYSDILLPKFAVDGSGVMGARHSTYPPQTMWHSASGDVGNAWFECDLGQICDITKMTIYNYSDTWSDLDNTAVSIREFNVLVSNDGDNYTQFGPTFTARKAPGDNGSPADWPYTIFDLTGAVGRFVKIDVVSNYGANTVGFGEVILEGGYTELGTTVPPSSITATASSTNSGYDVQNIVNGNGLYADGYGSHTWTDQSAGPNGWIGSLNSGPVTLIFTFDEPHNLASVRIWNMSSWFSQGDAAVKDFQLQASTDGTVFTPITTGQLNGNAYSTIHDYSQSFELATDNVVAVKMILTSNHTSGGTTGNVGLNEIQFVQSTGPIVSLTLQNTVPDEHGHWYDSYDEAYRVYDRWYFDANDVTVDLSAHDSVNFFIRPPTGYMICADETCSMDANLSMYDTTWTTEPFSGWTVLGGTSELQGVDLPDPNFTGFASKIDGARQVIAYYLSEESDTPWLWRSLILKMDISTLSDTAATYSFGNNDSAGLFNFVTFSSLTDSLTDTGIFTTMIADVDYTLAGFARLAMTWQLSDGEEAFDVTWDFHADGTIDMSDLAIFTERWLLGQ